MPARAAGGGTAAAMCTFMFGEEGVAKGSGDFDAAAVDPVGDLEDAVVLRRDVGGKIRFYLVVRHPRPSPFVCMRVIGPFATVWR